MSDWQIIFIGGMTGAILGLVYDLHKKVSKIYAAMKSKGEVE